MLFWYVTLSFAIVLVVFDSAALDYRLVMAGALVPWLDVLWGPPWVLHSVFFPVAAMVAVMVVGWGRRLLQRQWLGLPIGMFMHLVLAGSWTDTAVFWWPVFGAELTDRGPQVPPLEAVVLLEAVGLVVGVWLWKRCGFADRPRRLRFARRGQIDRSLL